MIACTTNCNIGSRKYNIMPGLIVRHSQGLSRMVKLVGPGRS